MPPGEMSKGSMERNILETFVDVHPQAYVNSERLLSDGGRLAQFPATY